MTRRAWAAAIGVVALGGAMAIRSSRAAPPEAGPAAPSANVFQAVTRPLFEDTCSECHNPSDADGGFDVSEYTSMQSLVSKRAGWEKIVAKLRSGEMPPAGVERRQDRIDDLVRFLDAELARADESAAPDSGRVTLRRLNRTEYTNTIRDLLALEFRADKAFPADDTGDGFDNMGDVLTVSPVLMEKYLSAAERISRRALAAEPLPKPIEVDYNLKFENLRSVDASLVEATHHADYDADYELVVGMPGQRPAGAKPVTLGVWVDGKLASTAKVDPSSKGATSEPFSEERFVVSLPEGDHTLRAGFIGDAFVKTLSAPQLYDRKANKWAGSVSVVGPYASKLPKPSRKRILVCNPATGAACVDKILS